MDFSAKGATLSNLKRGTDVLGAKVRFCCPSWGLVADYSGFTTESKNSLGTKTEIFLMDLGVFGE